MQLIERVARDMGIAVEIDQVTVMNQAQALCFLGSPTVQIDGRDIEPAARHLGDFGIM